VIFSIGGLVLPAVEAEERVTPIDLAHGAQDVERFAINLARLLQSLDTDGDAANGIAIPASAAAVATPVDFDVPSSTFEVDPDVMVLVMSAGNGTSGLVSGRAATEHLSVALATSAGAGVTADIAGLWESRDVDGPGRSSYTSISVDGEISRYRSVPDPGATVDCFFVEHAMLTPLQGDDYLVADVLGGDGLTRMTLSRPSPDRLVTVSPHPADRTRAEPLARVDRLTTAELSLCSGESSQPPPVDIGSSPDIAGWWELGEQPSLDPLDIDDHAFRRRAGHRTAKRSAGTARHSRRTFPPRVRTRSGATSR